MYAARKLTMRKQFVALALEAKANGVDDDELYSGAVEPAVTLGDFSTAEQLYDEYIRLHAPDAPDPFVHEQYGEALQGLGRKEEAIQTFTDVLNQKGVSNDVIIIAKERLRELETNPVRSD